MDLCLVIKQRLGKLGLEQRDLAAMAEFERELIRERVKAGLRNARTKGKRLGRPRKLTNGEAILRLRSQGASWRAVGKALGVSAATAYCVGRAVSGP